MGAHKSGFQSGFEKVTLNKDCKTVEELAKGRSWLLWWSYEWWWCWRRVFPAQGPRPVAGPMRASLTREGAGFIMSWSEVIRILIE